MSLGFARLITEYAPRRALVLAALVAACGSDATGPDPVVALVFTVPPGNVTAGVPFAPALRVTALDSRGNTATAFTGPVTLALGANPGGGELVGPTTAAAVAGVASFPGVSIAKTGSGYTLQATAAGLPAVASTPFTVNPASATLLVFTVQPSTAVAGGMIAPAVQVTARDGLGNTATDFSGPVTLALAANPGGDTLAGTTTAGAVAGVATFAGISLDKSGVGYTLQASAAGLAAVASAPFSVTPAAATHLVFSVQPGNTTAGAVISPALQVTARDAFGNTATAFTDAVTVAIGTNPVGGTLAGTTTVNAVAGVAILGSLSIDRAGTGYTLSASAAGLSGATSTAFDVSVGAATAIAVVSGSGQTDTVAATLALPYVVRVTDAGGNGVSGVTVNWAVTGGGGTITPSSVTNATGLAQATRTLGIIPGPQTATGSVAGLAGSPVSFTATAVPGTASQLAFTVQPSPAAAGATITPAIQVTARDAFGNAVPAFTGTITLAIGTNPPGTGVLDGTASVAAVAGVASFPALDIDEAGAGYTLTAAATGLTGATSTAFAITPGPATQLAFTIQPSSATAGAAITPAVQVTARDAFGNTATTFAGTVTVAIGTNPGGGTLSGTSTVAASAGVATFSNLSINRTGAGYTLTAAATGLAGATSNAFNILTGSAALYFTVQPGNTVAGAAITPAVQVTARDALGNTATTFTGSVTLAIGTNPPGNGVLDGTTTIAAVAGVANFPGLNIDEAGAGYTLVASAGGLTGATSAAFTITPGTATQLAFTAQPGNAAAGATITPAVQVTARDAFGNTATSFAGSITVAIGTNPPGNGALDGTTSVAAVAGVATFAALDIDEAGPGYTLTAAATGLTGATSAAFTITPGPATQLAFTVQPGNTAAGAPFPSAVQVTARDALGNTATGFTGTVTVAIGTNPPPGGVLDGTTTVAAVAGVASFSDLNIDEVGTGYTLTAAATGLTGATSAAFTISAGGPAILVFTVEPSDAAAGAAFAPVVQVTARDALGNTATGFTGTIAVAIGTNPPSIGVLDGTTSVAAVAGVANFPGLNIDEAGVGYTLVASAGGLTGATSGAFTISPGAGTQLAFTVQPGNTAADAAITPAVQVTARDAFGNTAPTFTGTVALAIGTNPPGTGALDGTTSVAAIAGVATFPGINIDEAGAGYTLVATATGLTQATSAPFTITPGSANQLAFTVQPGNTAAGAAITPAVQVTARDALGNTATGFTGNVTLAIGTNPPGNGVLDGTTTVAATAGVASFPGINIDEVGTGYTLTAGATGLGGATSATFNITAGAASQLAFTVQPNDAVAGAAINPAVQVTALDAVGNLATGFTGTVTLAIGTNPPGNGVLDGTTSIAAVAGVATFSGVNIDEAGAGYTLTASATGLTGATSESFTILAGAATGLAFTVQPSATGAGVGISPAVQVTARDAFGNPATAFTGTVTLAIGTNPPGTGVLDGTAAVAAAAGVASFPGINIDEAGAGYTLVATATGLTQATSAPFTIAPGPATQLAFTVQPSNEAAGVAISPTVQVTARDALGNTATGFTGNVALAIGTNPPGTGALDGTTSVAAVAGVASFPGINIDEAGVGYTLTASSGSLTGATSATFNITPGNATQLAFTVQPSTVPAGVAITPAVQVTARDALGNTVTTFTGAVTLAIGTNPPGNGVLDGTTTVAAALGVASFPGIDIDEAGAGYTLTASAGGLTGATSGTFTITPGAATLIAFTVQPSNATAGAVITPAVQVSARDALGNIATGFTGTVTLAIGVNPPGTGVLDSTTSVAAVEGVATFPGLNIDEAGVGYTLVASAAGVPDTTSATFTITPAAATQLAFTVQPTNAATGATITPAVEVTARDAFGNTSTGFTGLVTLAIGTNPPGNGVLDGTTSVAAIAGVAVFSTLDIDEAGTGYTLAASATGLSGAISTPFTINGTAATQLAFTVQPSNEIAGVAITPAVQVTARDAQGATVAGFTGNITISISTNPGGSTLSGTTTVAAVAGVATFSNLSLDRSASGYRLQATSPGLATATSTTFAIAPAAATGLVFHVQPTTVAAGTNITPAVRVRVVDAFGNTAGNPRRDITVALANNPGGATLSGNLMRQTGPINNADSGVAIFNNLSLDKVGVGYTLAATSAGLAPDTSTAFAITPGAASQLAFTVPPTTTAAGASITPAIQVTARDAFGNTATAFTGNVTLAIGTNPPGNGALDGATTVAAVAGIATFSGLNIDEAGVGYTLTASDGGGVTGATSAAFTITPGAATQLAFTVQPSNTAAGAAITPAVQVTARDAFGNTATAFTGTVALAIGTNPPGDGVLDGTTSVAAVAGIASFPGVNIDETGAGFTLTAGATGLTGATSVPFAITGGGVSATLSTLSAATDSIGQCLAPCALGFGASRVTVTVLDGFGNPVSGAAVTLSATSADSNVFTNPGPSGVTDANGVFQADFSSGQVTAKVVSAVAAGVTLSRTDTVHVMPVLVGAGDIADCNRLGDDATANLLDGIPGRVFALGDNAYPNGRTQDFANCYDPTWGRHKARTRPAAGNHEYDSSATAAPYFAYFGSAAGTAPDGWYSYDVGAWHVVVLNDNVPMTALSPQVTWLRQDLNGRRNQCVLAYWHRPRYSSGPAGNTSGTQALWQALADSAADIVMWGHDHTYERFAPMDAAGNASATGIRAFVVGTGGGETLGSSFPIIQPNSVVRDNTTRGVLRLTLYAGRYRWEFLPAPGFGTFTDSGSGNCN